MYHFTCTYIHVHNEDGMRTKPLGTNSFVLCISNSYIYMYMYAPYGVSVFMTSRRVRLTMWPTMYPDDQMRKLSAIMYLKYICVQA